MDRNIITTEDVLLRRSSTRSSGTNGPVQEADDYLARTLKQIPFEIVGAYLVLDGIIRSGVQPDDKRFFWLLLGIYVFGLVSSVMYARSILHVVRPSQLTMTALAFTVWIFSTGGVFQLGSWYEPWMGSVSVVVFAVLIRLVRVGPLPSEAANID